MSGGDDPGGVHFSGGIVVGDHGQATGRDGDIVNARIVHRPRAAPSGNDDDDAPVTMRTMRRRLMAFAAAVVASLAAAVIWAILTR